MIFLVPLAIAVVVCAVAVWRTRTEPRRLSNAYWLLAGAMLLINVLGGVGLVVVDLLSFTIVAIALLSPLLVLVLCGFLIMNGVVMLRRERASLANSLSLLAGLTITALVVLLIPVFLSGPLWLRSLWLLGLLAAGYLGFHFVAFLGYGRLYTWLVRNRPATWVMVLGSGLRRGTEVPPLLASRIRAGIAEFSRRGARVLIMSGGQGRDEKIAEGTAMAGWAVEQGVDPAVVRAEIKSRTTEQNLRYTGELVRAEAPATEGPGLIVTSNYHVLRAAILARKTGLDAQAAGAPTAGYYWPSAMIREYVAILRERLVLHAVLLPLVAVPLPLALLIAAG
ncbi:YdcF family protein [Microlunatus sp. GCM10028923]|uniref:YdcF family protein n=1 Tax=Microlunatus sp. GCM10028923 TaxID=3273400 RepID=UPI003620CDD5